MIHDETFICVAFKFSRTQEEPNSDQNFSHGRANQPFEVKTRKKILTVDFQVKI